MGQGFDDDDVAFMVIIPSQILFVMCLYTLAIIMLSIDSFNTVHNLWLSIAVSIGNHLTLFYFPTELGLGGAGIYWGFSIRFHV